MHWPRHSACIRAFTLLFLLWIGLDVGAHGFFASDRASLASGAAAFVACTDDAPASTGGAADHCFCHSLSVGAVAPAHVADLAVAGTSVAPLATFVPQADRHPLDLPPRFAA